jgi:hypothetical protein
MQSDIEKVDLQELGRRLFARELNVIEVAELYTREEMLDLVSDRTSRMARAIEGMSPDQLSYRLPGTPGDWDASGDEAEFDISEIVTHVATGTTFYWFNIARALGHPRPRFLRPPREVPITGRSGSVLGRGGWSGVPASELAALLETTTSDFFTYLSSITAGEEEILGTFEGYGDLTMKGWLLLLAVHYDMHLKQILHMIEQADFPDSTG